MKIKVTKLFIENPQTYKEKKKYEETENLKSFISSHETGAVIKNLPTNKYH